MEIGSLVLRLSASYSTYINSNTPFIPFEGRVVTCGEHETPLHSTSTSHLQSQSQYLTSRESKTSESRYYLLEGSIHRHLTSAYYYGVNPTTHHDTPPPPLPRAASLLLLLTDCPGARAMPCEQVYVCTVSLTFSPRFERLTPRAWPQIKAGQNYRTIERVFFGGDTWSFASRTHASAKRDSAGLQQAGDSA